LCWEKDVHTSIWFTAHHDFPKFAFGSALVRAHPLYIMRRGHADADAEAADGQSWVDDRLAAEPKAPGQKRSRDAKTFSAKNLMRLGAIAAACWLIGAHQLVFAIFTGVSCSPSTVRAGSNISCTITRSALASESDLSITQVGNAGAITLVDEASTQYRVTFSTRAAGAAGVRVTHSLFWRTSWAEVQAAPAATVDVACEPAQVAPRAEVRCAVTPRDVFGNVAEVEKPPGASADYFSVQAVGGARDIVVHDEHVSLVAGDAPGSRAGIAVVLAGTRMEGSVAVIG
jgi:hypothetical protein